MKDHLDSLFQAGVCVLQPSHNVHGSPGLLPEEQVQAQASGHGDPVRARAGQEHHVVLDSSFDYCVMKEG